MQLPSVTEAGLDELVARMLRVDALERAKGILPSRRAPLNPGRPDPIEIIGCTASSIEPPEAARVAAHETTHLVGAVQLAPPRTKAERMSAVMAWNNYVVSHNGRPPRSQPLCPRF